MTRKRCNNCVFKYSKGVAAWREQWQLEPTRGASSPHRKSPDEELTYFNFDCLCCLMMIDTGRETRDAVVTDTLGRQAL